MYLCMTRVQLANGKVISVVKVPVSLSAAKTAAGQVAKWVRTARMQYSRIRRWLCMHPACCSLERLLLTGAELLRGRAQDKGMGCSVQDW